MDSDDLTILRAVKKGPCAEFDDRPFWRLRSVKERGLIEPYDRQVVPRYGPSTLWTLSPSGRERLNELEAGPPERQRP